jgi:threonine dehydratase
LGNTSPDTIADGLRTTLAERTFAIIRQNVDGIVTVSEHEIVDAMRFLWERMKLVVEPSGAVSLAGVLSRKIPVGGTRVGVILSGGNVDLADYFQTQNEKIAKEHVNG